jgi:ZIP family zinc transporter
MSSALVALALTVLAGLSTGIGSAIAFFFRRPGWGFLSFALGLSGGVMLYVSFVELLPAAMDGVGQGWAVLAFFLGIVFIAAVDLAIPHDANPHEAASEGELDTISTVCGTPAGPAPERVPGRTPEAAGPAAARGVGGGSDEEAVAALRRGYTRRSGLMRAGMMTALAIGIHNFPEGLATFATSLNSLDLGVAIAIAIAIHNVPEGISVSVPIFYATGDRMRAFKLSFLSGLAEPVGAVVGYAVLLPFLSSGVLASLLAFVAGIMVYISLDELLPLAHEYGTGHTAILGIMAGMAVMAGSLLLLAAS